MWWGRRRFVRRIGLALAVFFGLTFATSALALALLSGTVGVGRHRGAVFAAGIAGLGLLFAGFVLAGRVVREAAVPLSEVMDAADRVADGDYDVRVQERGGVQMRRLARSFNAMAERLRSSERERRNLLADVAHELRTPLSVIQGNTEGMLDGVYPADRGHLEPVVEETRVMARLLDDLQTLSTAEAGVLQLHRETVEPAHVVDDALAAFRSQADAAGVTLAKKVSSGLPPLEVDAVRVGQVLANLLSNALRHTPSGGTVTVSAEPDRAAGAVAFEVEDTGEGIPPNALPHVFDRFVKGAGSVGAGLGLAIARSLVRAHGGSITAASRLGHGTAMRFTIPVTPTL
jgi:signal transduction histidine kinase